MIPDLFSLPFWTALTVRVRVVNDAARPRSLFLFFLLLGRTGEGEGAEAEWQGGLGAAWERGLRNTPVAWERSRGM